MKILPYVKKLEQSNQYKTFKQKYEDAYIVAGFFILDFEQGKNLHQIDLYIPSQKQVAAFTLDKNVSLQLLKMMNNKTPEQLDINTKIDLDSLKGILTDEMKNRNITEEITKMIAVVQNVKGKKIWNVNCVLSGMEILKAHIEDDSKTVLKIEKVSMMDLIKKIPVKQLQAPKQKPTKEDAKQALQQLNKMQEEIQKEKERLKKELIEEHGKK